MKQNKGIVARVISVLGAFADGESALAISQLSERLDLPPSSVHRLLEQLIELEVIERANHHRYRIGPEFFRIGSRAEGKFRIIETARPLMHQLVNELNETCVLSVLTRSNLRRLRVAKLDSPNQPLKFKLRMLESHSLIWGAASRTILAYMGPEDIEQAFAEAPQISPIGKRLPTFESLNDDLRRIRAAGYAFAVGGAVSTETIAVAAPLFGPGDKILGELCVVMPAFRFEDYMLGSIGAQLVHTTQRLSVMMGATAKSHSSRPDDARVGKGDSASQAIRSQIPSDPNRSSMS